MKHMHYIRRRILVHILLDQQNLYNHIRRQLQHNMIHMNRILNNHRHHNLLLQMFQTTLVCLDYLGAHLQHLQQVAAEEAEELQ